MQFPFSKIKLPRFISTSTALTTSKNRVAEQNCLSLFQSCNSLPKLAQLHASLIKFGLQTNPLVLTKFASTSSDLNEISYAESFIFASDAKIHLYDTFLFNTIIRAYAQTGHSKQSSVFYYNLMLEYDILPNKFTYPFVLKACAGLHDLKLGHQFHGLILKIGFDTDLHVQNTMVHMYACCDGGIDFAQNLFDEIAKSDSVSWSAMIGGYAKVGRSIDAVRLFRKMQMSGVCADEITMVCVLSACTDLGALELGKWIESYIEREEVQKTVELSNSLIDMFAKCGDIDKAMKLFKNMKEKTIVTYTSLIFGLAMNGRGLEAISLFEEMERNEIFPDDVAFIGLLYACSHSGLVEKGHQYFNLMKNEFFIVPKIEHYGCMVDLFGRAGLVKEALDFVQKMPIEPNPIIWRTLISCCRAHGELELGESITKMLIQNEPMQDSNYVLLSHIYAKMSHWEKKTKIREVMDKKGMRKVPGTTMIELDNEIYEFVSGDTMHSQYKEIYEMVDEMGREIKKVGYIPTTSEVLVDIGEEDKEDALNRHSERLAIAFALLKTPPATPIRIVKNLRVCSDCHLATKFISKIYNREIVVRDRSRFHHFKDGVCSCNEFW